jgi:2-methylcitrate dehydratase PrpD
MMAWESDPTENARPFQMGVAARNGVTAALLAERGFGGPRGVFDEGHTVFNAFSRAPQPQKLTEALGQRWDGVLELAVKPYSCVSFLHPALDALLGLAHEHGINADDVEALVMRFPRSGVHCVDGNPLKSHCAQYILPVALANNELRVADIFVDQRDTSPAVAALCRRVSVIADDGEIERLFPDFYATVIELKTKDGRTFVRRNDIARGYPETPLSEAEIDAKFRRLACTVASTSRVEALYAAIHALPTSDRLDRYAELLRGQAEAEAQP